MSNTVPYLDRGIISYPLFADADMGIYPHAESQYHARPKAKRGIAMLSVNKFPYPRMQTRGDEFIPFSNDICQILTWQSALPFLRKLHPENPRSRSWPRSQQMTTFEAKCSIDTFMF